MLVMLKFCRPNYTYMSNAFASLWSVSPSWCSEVWSFSCSEVQVYTPNFHEDKPGTLINKKSPCSLKDVLN